MVIEIYRRLKLIDAEEKEIQLFCNYEIKNDGIGGYEFWGSRGYDQGVNYLELNRVNWDTSLYSEKENKSILDWVVHNWDGIEKEVESRQKELQEPDINKD